LGVPGRQQCPDLLPRGTPYIAERRRIRWK